MSRRVVVIPGDGIGPSVIEATRRVLDATGVALAWDEHEVGAAAFERGGDALPDAVVDAARGAGVVLKGPVTTPADGRFPSANLGLKRRLGLYVQVRRCRSYWADGVDVLVAREATEDVYAGIELRAGSEAADDLAGRLRGQGFAVAEGAALTVKPASEAATRRAARAVAAAASAAGRRRVTVVHKATAMPATDGLFLRAAREELAAAGMEVDDLLVDLAAAELVKQPSRFDVIFTTNLYGDILADLAGAVVGSVGLVPGANYGDDVAMFEPAHGSAPRHAGADRVNPTAAILSGALLLRHVGEGAAATAVEWAVAEVLRRRECVTYDVAAPGVDPVSTTAMTDAILTTL